MRRALVGARQSRIQGISNFLYRNWSRTIPRHSTLRLCSRPKRHASSFPFTAPAPSRRQAWAAAEEVTSDEDLSFSEALKRAVSLSLSRQRNLAKTETALVNYPPAGSALYGKWESLSLDEERLLYESDMNVSDGRLVRLVDQPGNEDDIELWCCLLDFVHRRMGRNGVLMIWQAVFKRRNLYQTTGSLPQAFWRTILAATVSSNALAQVLIYAKWLYETHGVRWPHLYTGVMFYMLDNGRTRDVVRWHKSLAACFEPDKAEFVDLLKKFIMRTEYHVQQKVQLLYRYSTHRGLYDVFIPRLYNEGHAKLAMEWRKVFRAVNDGPVSMAARPFLRFIEAYQPQTRLTQDELKVAGLDTNEAENEESTIQSPGPVIKGQDLSYLINRVHGETFGIQEKPYNDELGAKWFASSWVSLDFAINVIYTMGIQSIGPLSLQSIALREESAQGVLQRMDQLQRLKINLPVSNYARAIHHYATVGDNDALRELLWSDIHPDVFDDETAQQELLQGCALASDWKTFQLILKTYSVALSGSMETSSNRVLEHFVSHGDGGMALKMLQEMSSRKVDLAPMTSHLLSIFILKTLSAHTVKDNQTRQQFDEARRQLDVQISICRQLATTRFPPAVEVWQRLLYRLGRERRLIELERLSLQILRLFNTYSTSEQPMWISHMADVPQSFRRESPYMNFQLLPRDLSIRHETHPLRQIFDNNLQRSIVRWGFSHTRYDREAEDAAAAVVDSSIVKGDGSGNAASTAPPMVDTGNPASFHFARGIRLLSILRAHGLFTYPLTIRKQAIVRLVDLYRGDGRKEHEWVDGNKHLSERRHRNKLSMAVAKRLCDVAWETDEIVPSLLELRKAIEVSEMKDQVPRLKRRMAVAREMK